MRHFTRARLFALICLSVACAGRPAPGADIERVDFARDIRPILADNCFHCHGPDPNDRQADLRLDTREGLLGRDDTVVIPGDSGGSALYQRMAADDPDERMPPADSEKQLTPDQIALIARWIDEGAIATEHWAFQPPARPAPPPVQRADWVRNPIDAFVLARLEREELAPNDQASDAMLIRRVTFDLTGLPPTLEAVDSYLADTSTDKYERLVDRLLESSAYGEHLARHWLDAARYGDSHGLHADSGRSIWPYRDWVIQSFNSGMPYDQFLIEQIAGDLLPNPTVDQLVATGFNRCHVTTNEQGSIKDELRVRYTVDRVETLGSAIMGMTLGCAVCHDHKFDPISQREFYQLYAFFNSTADEAMDGNALAPPPTVTLRPPELQRRIETLAALADELEAMRRRRCESPDYEHGLATWLAQEGNNVECEPPRGCSLVAHVRTEAAVGDGNAPAPNRSDELPNACAIDVSEPFTLAAQLRISDSEATPPLFVQKGPKGADECSLEVAIEDRRLIVRLVIATDELVEARSVSQLSPPGRHVIVTYDGSGEADGLVLYVDGESADFDVSTEASARSGVGARTLRIGTRDIDSNNETPVVTEAQVFRGAIVAADAAALARASSVRAALRTPAVDRTSDQVELLRRCYCDELDPVTRPIDDAIAAWRTEKEKIERLPAPVSLITLELPTPRDAHVLNRGAYDQPGDKVARSVPAMFPPMPLSAPRNRLGLAQWLTAAEHPLTSRVQVNRLWQMLFGVGIVATSDDFGSQGEPPTHPELLEWLAVEFRESGWDVRHVLRLITTSATYRQSSAAAPELFQRDPDNRLLARGPRFRLDAESIRDNALALGGLLVMKVGGPSVKPYQPDGVWEAVAFPESGTTRKYAQDHGESLYRRSLYTFWKRTAPPPAMTVLDAPSRERCIARRSRTNVPTQALLLLNDVQFVEAARQFAARIMVEGGESPDERAAWGFRLATSRSASGDELRILVETYRRQARAFNDDRAAASALLGLGEAPRDSRLDVAEHAAWTVVANLILNLDEVLTKE